MAQYILIESRDPFDSNDVPQFYELAGNLAKNGDTVSLFLVQNGVLPTRQGVKSTALADLAGMGVEILADEFSLSERGIGHDRLASGVKPAPLDVVVDHLADGRKAIWH